MQIEQEKKLCKSIINNFLYHEKTEFSHRWYSFPSFLCIKYSPSVVCIPTSLVSRTSQDSADKRNGVLSTFPYLALPIREESLMVTSTHFLQQLHYNYRLLPKVWAQYTGKLSRHYWHVWQTCICKKWAQQVKIHFHVSYFINFLRGEKLYVNFFFCPTDENYIMMEGKNRSVMVMMMMTIITWLLTRSIIL